MPKLIPLQTKQSILKCFNIFKKDRPDLDEEAIICRLQDVFNVGRSLVLEILKNKNVVKKIMPKRGKSDIWNHCFKEGLAEIIRGFNIKNEFFTLQELLNIAKNLIDFNGGRSTLHSILRSMGFKFKIVNSRKILCEQKHFKILKVNYCQKFLQFIKSSENYLFVYLDEIGIYQNGSQIRRWIHDTDHTFNPAKIKNEGKRYTILHAGCEYGWLEGCDLFLDCKNSDKDYHKSMTGDKKWVEDQLIPALTRFGRKCVVVMDNAPYHSMLLDKPPTFAFKKSIMEEWLSNRTDKDANYYKNLKKKELWELIKHFRNDYTKKYIIDELLKRHGHEVLRLPPYHCQFNPIEMAWHVTKDYYNNHINLNSTSTNENKALWLESLSQCTSDIWKNCMHCDKLVRDEWALQMGNTSFDDLPPLIISLAEPDSESNDDCETDSESEVIEEI